MTTEGQHLLLDIWFEKDMEEVVAEVCELVRNNFKVVETACHRFEPQGTTIVYILSESHFTIHTYPEHNYISMDVYICNPQYDLSGFADKVLEITSPTHYNAALDKRGVKNS